MLQLNENNSIERFYQKNTFFWHDFHRLEKHLLVYNRVWNIWTSGNLSIVILRKYTIFIIWSQNVEISCIYFQDAKMSSEKDRWPNKLKETSVSDSTFFQMLLHVDFILSDWIQNSIFIFIWQFYTSRVHIKEWNWVEKYRMIIGIGGWFYP